ncbi:kinectin-like isoform X2 [Tachysurus ichikawai]
MSKDSLFELLNLSIDSTEGSVVNFKSLHLLLYNLVSRHGAERETAGQPPTASEDKAILSRSLMQDLIKENKELKEEANNLKEEVETLRDQLDQCVTSEDMQAALVMERQNMLKVLKDSIIGSGPSDTSREVNFFLTKELEARVEHLEVPVFVLCMFSWTACPNLGMESMFFVTSGIVEEFSKPEVTASYSSESISASEQQLHLQTADLRNSFQKLDEEMQNVKQKLQEQKEISEKEMQHKLGSLQSIQDNMSLKTNELFQFFENLQSIVTDLINDIATEKARDVHGTVLLLQTECEKLHSTTNQLMKEQEQEQSHTKDLYNITKELEEKKADKDEVKIVEDLKADMQTLETKVLLCDTAADQLNRMIQDIASNICDHEENSQRVNEKILRELDCKLNYTEMDGLKRQLEECKMKIFQLDTQTTDSYDAAVIRK